ncbi:MAG: hypothetical protein D6732_09960 [Methanobacteriota archaeon]|nr:MAG: hypothetical protein D6732_09960 [Euryarchaeota archaeon]
MSEKEKVTFFVKKKDIPPEIFIIAATDSSMVVRANVITHLKDIVTKNPSLIKIMKLVAEKDPEPTIRKAARLALEQIFV